MTNRTLPEIITELEKVIDRIPSENIWGYVKVGDNIVPCRQHLKTLILDIEDHIPKRDDKGRFIKKPSFPQK